MEPGYPMIRPPETPVVGPASARTRSEPRRGVPFALLAAAAALLAGAAGALWLLRRPPIPAPPLAPAAAASTAAPRRSIAVLGFSDQTGRRDAGWIATALAEMMAESLAEAERLRVVPGEDVARMRAELFLESVDSLTAETLGRVRANLGSDLLVTGAYRAGTDEATGELTLDVAVRDTVSGSALSALSVGGRESDLFSLASRAAHAIRERLDAAGGGTRRSGPVVNREAARLYAQGLERLRRFDALAARDLLERSVQADPAFPLAHSALSAAWAALGYEEKAVERARRAFELSSDLPPQRRRFVEGRYREAQRDWAGAIEAYGSLFRFASDDLEYGLRLASVQTAAGKGTDALATLDTLRRLPRPISGDPRIDLAESQAALALADYPRSRAAAVRAAAAGRVASAELLVAAARLSEARALYNLGENAAAVGAAEESQRLYLRAEDRGGVALALLQQADVLRYEGGLAEAQRRAEKALEIARSIGQQSAAAEALNRIATVLTVQGRLRQAREMSERARALYAEVGNRGREGAALNHVGVALWQEGRLAEAKRTLGECVKLFTELRDRRGISFANANLGYVLLARGELAAARSALETARRAADQIGFRSVSGFAVCGLGRLDYLRGDRSAARGQYEEALQTALQIGQRGRVAETLVALAALELDEGRPQQAAQHARDAATEFRREQARADEALAEAMLARGMLAQGQVAAAAEPIARAAGLVHASEHSPARVSVALVEALVHAAAGAHDQAITGLVAVVTEALERPRRSSYDSAWFSRIY